MSTSDYRALAEAALAVGRRRAERLDEIRAALIEGENERALSLMRVYVGIEEGRRGDKSNRSDSGLH